MKAEDGIGAGPSKDFKKGAKKEENTPYVRQFYLKLYEHALESQSNLDHDILQKQSDARTKLAVRAEKIHANIHTDDFSERGKLDASRPSRRDADEGLRDLHRKLLNQEPLLQMQEDRRLKAIEEIQTHEADAELKMKMAETLLQEGLQIQESTLYTRSTVEAYRAYKDYVERSVPLWEREASSVSAVCGRFRDLLTLRLQLLIQVDEAFKQLQQKREDYQRFVKSEKVAEGKSLLQVYTFRSLLWKSSREAEASEAHLRSLRNASAVLATHLTRVKLALANMYSVARRFQSSLSLLEPDTPSTDILVWLHNFLIDATKVVEMAKLEEKPSSQIPMKGSIDQKLV